MRILSSCWLFTGAVRLTSAKEVQNHSRAVKGFRKITYLSEPHSMAHNMVPSNEHAKPIMSARVWAKQCDLANRCNLG